MGNAQKKRKEIVAEAAKLRKEVDDRIQSLKTQIEGGEIKVKGLESDLAEAERQERGKVVKHPGKGGKLSMLAQLARDRIDELREALNEVRSHRKTAESRLEELETILSTFKDEYNPNFNDEGVKRAVRSWEDYAARDKSAGENQARERDIDELVKPDSESGAINWNDWEEPEESDVDVCKSCRVLPIVYFKAHFLIVYKIEAYLPASVRSWIDQKLRDLRVLLIENGILAPAQVSESESKELVDARNALKAGQDSLNDNKNQLNTHVEDLTKDYGVDDVFRALKGQCISKASGEYTYELCWLDKTKQISKKNGGHTTMGNFVSINKVIVDDDVPVDGKGLGSGERIALKYENGQNCWNGPNRSTMVVLACSEDNEIWKITEEEKCVYRMQVGTPAVCEVSGKKEVPRDEL